MKMYVSYIFHKLIIFRLYCILDTTYIVETCDYLHLDNEIHFTKLLKMFVPGARRKTRNKNRVKQS